jgi:hypothetical protein
MIKKMLIVFISLLFLATAEFVAQKPQQFLLKDPSVIQLELVPGKDQSAEAGETSASGIYEAGSKVIVRIDAINSSQEPVTLIVVEPSRENRPELFRSGDKLDYSDGLMKTLEAREHDLPRSMPQLYKLEPGERKRIGYINLRDWYDPLGSGHYQLSIKHRFEVGQKWIESASVTFEVIPKKRGKRT